MFVNASPSFLKKVTEAKRMKVHGTLVLKALYRGIVLKESSGQKAEKHQESSCHSHFTGEKSAEEIRINSITAEAHDIVPLEKSKRKQLKASGSLVLPGQKERRP